VRAAARVTASLGHIERPSPGDEATELWHAQARIPARIDGENDMTFTDLAGWSQLFSSLAVLVTLIYLAIEIRQNTEALHAQTRQALLSGSQTELFHMAERPEFLANLIRDDKLSQDEYGRLHAFLTALMRAREFSWLQHRKGIIDKDLWETEQGVIVINLTPVRGKRWWAEVGRHLYNSAFVAFVDKLLEDKTDSGFLAKTLDWESD
jgi:hypothetical protein